MAEELNASLLTADPDAPGAPRISAFSQIGIPGLKVVNKSILEEADSKWKMPARIKTVNEMKTDGSVAIGLLLYKILIGRRRWKIIPPVGATEQQKERAKFVESCMHDLDENKSWQAVIDEILSFLDYGFCIVEKQYKRRNKGKSKHDDGLAGIAGLHVRSQSTVTGWIYSEDGRRLEGVEQSTANLQYGARYMGLESEIKIPREKFLLFRNDVLNDNPEGNSLLKPAYHAFRAKREMENQQLIGASRELTGLLKMTMPAAYLSADADQGKQAVAEDFKKVARNISMGQQSAVILPSDRDETTKSPLFDLDLVASSGARAFDTTKIIDQLTSAVLMALLADIAQLGGTLSGDGKLSLLEAAVDYKVKQIEEVLNSDLIPQLFQMNGWSDKDFPRFVAEGEEMTPDELSKLLQRTGAIGLIEADRHVLNKVREMIGVQLYAEDVEPQEKYLTGNTSRSGDGMAAGGLDGTSQGAPTRDNSSQNSDNAS